MAKVEKVSKRSLAVDVMKANATKSMAEVVVLIADRINVTEANAKSYYRYIVEHKLAPGNVAKAVRAPKAKKSKEVSAKKLLKEVGVKTGKSAPKSDKSPDEIAKIKAANLQRMREVAAKRKQYTNVAAPEGPGVPNFNAKKAKAQVEAFMNGDDDALNDTPTFLTKDQLKVLV